MVKVVSVEVVNISKECLIISVTDISDCKERRGSSQRHHGARLKVKVNQSVCDGADAGGGRACSHLALLKALEVTLKGKQEEDKQIIHEAVSHLKHLL